MAVFVDWDSTFSQEAFQGVILLVALPHILLAGS